jgi:hypothetical protein
MVWRVLFLLSILLNCVLGAALLASIRGKNLVAVVSHDLDRERLLGIRAGDSCEHVINAIGYPLVVSTGGTREQPPAERRRGSWPDWYVWSYAQPGFFEGLSVTIGMRDCEVTFVSAKNSGDLVYLVDDAGVRQIDQGQLRSIPSLGPR